MTVGLPAVTKGTHMSRFIELVEAQTAALDLQGFRELVLEMLERLEARGGTVEMRFPYFVRKFAPVSGVASLLDCDVRWRGSVSDDGRYSFWMHVTVPATSLCPCSKEISAYGAHNQRSLISIEAELGGEMAIEELIAIAERSASCEVYGLLKRPDEKYVTERAYDNPKFVEDLVRDVALELNREPRVRAYTVEAENFESIHNHSAFARLVRPAPNSRACAVGRAASARPIDGDNGMSTHEVSLIAREEIAAGTMAFHFEKPPGFSFKPGQAIDVVLIDPPPAEAQSARHTFSLISAPSQGELAVATRMRDSAFKRALQSLTIGAHSKLEGPFGSLTLHTNRARPAVFIAGGIGITPFMSILRQAASDKLPQHLILIYSNRRPEDAAFLAELQQLERQNKNFRLIATMTQLNQSSRPWQGATGVIDEGLLKRVGSELSAPIYYLAGPPSMVEGMRQTLNRAGINDDDIRSEEFYGY